MGILVILLLMMSSVTAVLLMLFARDMLQGPYSYLLRPDVVQLASEPPLWVDTTEATVTDVAGCQPCGQQRGSANQPALGLSFDAASTWCEQQGGRLPTEAEWLRMAGDAKHPWGAEAATCNHAIAQGCSRPDSAGSAWRGGTEDGVMDLAGSAWEWVVAEDGPALIGGGMNSPASELGKNGRRSDPSGAAHADAGLRCVYDHAR
jgi:hypothetical protein